MYLASMLKMAELLCYEKKVAFITSHANAEKYLVVMKVLS